MNNLKFEKQNDTTWVAKIYNGTYSRFYHVINYGDCAGLKIFGSNRKAEIRYDSVKTAMSVAVKEHKKWVSRLKKEEKKNA